MNLSKKMLKLENGFFDTVNKAGVKIFIKGCGKAVYSVVALRCQKLSDRTEYGSPKCPMTLNITFVSEPCRLFQLFQMNISVISNVFKMSTQSSEKFADESQYSRKQSQICQFDDFNEL